MTEEGKKRVAVVGIPVIAIFGFLFHKIDSLEARERRALERAAEFRVQHEHIIRTLEELKRAQERQTEWMYWRFGAPPKELARDK